MNGNKTRVILILALASAHLLVFQNCSKIAFSNTDALAEKAGSNQAAGFEPNDTVDNGDDSEDLADNNDSDIDGVAGDNSPDMADNSFDDKDLDTDYHSGGDAPLTNDELADTARDEAACAAFRAQEAAGFDYTFNSTIVKIHRVRGSVLVLGAEILNAKNIRGSLYVHAPLKDSPSKIKNVRGPLCVVSTASGTIRKIKNHRGFAELSDLSGIRQLRNMRGKLIIRNSTVDRIINHRGPIVLINSRVDRIRNQRGSITLLGSSSVGKAKNVRP